MPERRNRKHPPPAPGGASDQATVAGPLTYHYPMPPAKSFGKLIPCDDEMEVEVVTPTPPPATAVRITVTRQPAAPAEQSSGNAATLAALESLLRQYAAAGYQIKFELTADART